MIKRYSRKEMTNIWSSQQKYNIWFEIEAYACEAMALLGKIPQSAVTNIWKKGTVESKKIDEIEKTTKHDVIAFLTNLAESIGEDSRFVHQGMTSSDVLDTTFSIQLKKANNILLSGIDKLLLTLKKRAYEHKNTLTIGRSHGIHAEPMTFGLKLASFYSEFQRNKIRLKNADLEISICAISGAIGTFANVDPFVERYVADKLNLIPENISTQIIPRDRHAMYFSTLGVIASSIERIATEIRHLQRTEVREVEEFFSTGQKGSSAMPHKRNPVLTENLTGLARLIRGSIIPALENVSSWHERDISHSSVERIIGPDVTVTLDFALNRLNQVMENLIVYPKKMKENLDLLGGLVFSQQILLLLTQNGFSRESAYEIVQSNAMEVWKTPSDKRKDLFQKLLLKDNKIISKVSKEDIIKQFDYNYHTKNVDVIFERVFKN